MSAAASNFLVVLHLALAPIPLCAALALVWLGRATRTAEILHRHPSHRSHPATAVPRAWLLPLTYTSLVLCAVQIALAGARWLTVLDETADAAGGSSTAPADQTIPTTLLNALMLSVGLVSQTFCDALVAFQLSELARRLPAVVAVDTTQSSASVAVVSGGTFPFLRLAMWASAGTAVVVRVFAQAALIFLIAGSTTRDLPAVQIATLCVKVGSAVAIAIFHTAMVAHRLYIQHARFPNAALQGPLAIPLVLSTTCAILASAHTVTATLAVWTLFLLSYVLGCAYLTLSTAWPGTLAVVAVDATDGLPRSSGSTVTMHGQHSAPNGAMRKRIQHTEYGRVSDSAAELAPVSWDRAPLLPDAIDLDNVHSPVPEIQTVAPSRQQVAAAAAASVAVDPHALAHSEWPIRSSGLSNTSSHLTGTGAPPGPALATLVKHVATDTSSSSPPPTDAHSLPYRTLYAADITAAMRAVTSSASPPASLVDPLPVSSSTSLPLTAATPTVAPIAPSPAASPLLKQPQKSAGAAPPRPAPLPDLRLDLSSFRFRGPNEVTDRFVSFVEERFNVVARFYPAELLRAAIRRGPGPAGPPDAAQAQPTRTSSLDAELTPPSAAATADNGPADGRTGSTIDDVIAMANSPWFSAAAQCHRTMRESATVLPPSLLDVSMLAPKRAPTTAAAASNIVVMALPVHFNAKKLGVLVLWPWRSARLLLSSGETGLVRAPLPQDHERIFAMQMVSFFAAYLFSAVERQSNDETMRDFSQRLAVMEATARAKSTFLANMSHEIRTPASQVIQAAHMLAETNLSDEQQDHASVILKSGEQLLAILNDILDFSKLEDGKIRFENRTFDLHEAVRLSVDSFPLPAKPIDVGYYIGPGVPRFVVGDVVRLRQVFNNLLSNAIKFTDSGHVFIRAEVYREDTVGKTHLRFAVNDTGCGVPHERIAKIFERFEQSDDSITRIYGGTGLGLNICQSLCSLMGSRLHVSSVVGEGSQFSFQATFPTPEVGATDDSSVIASRSVRPMMSPPPNMLIVILASTPGRRGVEQDMFVFTQLLAPVGTATKTTCVSFSAWLDEEAISASSAAAVVLVSPQWPSLDQIQRLTKPTVLVCSDTLPVPSFRTQLQRAFLLSRPFKHSTFLRAVNSALRAGSAARSPVFPSVAISEDPVPMSPSHLHDLRPSLSLSLHSDPAILSQQPLRIGSTRLSESSTMHPPDSLASMSQTRPDASSARQQSLHVLVVDDNPVNRRMMQAMVAKLGHRVSLANNGREAVNVVKAASASDGVDPFDVVFMDIRMPIMDGLEATRLIVDHFVGKGPDGQTAASKSNHGRKPRRPIILGLSADALEEQERNGLESGMDRYLRKPLLRNDIAVALEQFFPHIVPAAVAAHHAHPAPMPPPAHSDRG